MGFDLKKPSKSKKAFFITQVEKPLKILVNAFARFDKIVVDSESLKKISARVEKVKKECLNDSAAEESPSDELISLSNEIKDITNNLDTVSNLFSDDDLDENGLRIIGEKFGLYLSTKNRLAYADYHTWGVCSGLAKYITHSTNFNNEAIWTWGLRLFFIFSFLALFQISFWASVFFWFTYVFLAVSMGKTDKYDLKNNISFDFLSIELMDLLIEAIESSFDIDDTENKKRIEKLSGSIKQVKTHIHPKDFYEVDQISAFLESLEKETKGSKQALGELALILESCRKNIDKYKNHNDISALEYVAAELSSISDTSAYEIFRIASSSVNLKEKMQISYSKEVDIRLPTIESKQFRDAIDGKHWPQAAVFFAKDKIATEKNRAEKLEEQNQYLRQEAEKRAAQRAAESVGKESFLSGVGKAAIGGAAIGNALTKKRTKLFSLTCRKCNHYETRELRANPISHEPKDLYNRDCPNCGTKRALVARRV